MAIRQHPCPACKEVFQDRNGQVAAAKWAQHWKDKHVNKKKGVRQS